MEDKHKFLKLLKVWWKITLLSVQSQLINIAASILFIIGKVVRFLLYFIFIYQVVSNTKGLAGYRKEEVMVFFLVFSLVDILTQFLFRGVYHFRPLIVSGDYDLDLLKPMPSFFRPIFGWTDVLDLMTLIPLVIYLIWYLSANNLVIGLNGVLFLLLLFNSILVAFSFHLFVCAVCVLTTEIDHLIMVYRDLTNMARFSTDIYPRAVQAVLTIVVPVVILMTIPAKGLLGILSWQYLILGLLLSAAFFVATIRFWKYSLRHYSSASS